MLQVRKIVNLALSRIGAINFGENPDSNTADLALDVFKLMLDEWSIRYSNDDLYVQSTPSKNIITLGTDTSNILSPVVGDISARPAQITEVFFQNGRINYSLNIRPYADYNFIPVQDVAAIPTDVFINYGYPYVTMYFYPQFGTNGTVKIIGKNYRTDETLSLNDYLDVPREWNSACVTNLALRLASYFGVSVTQDLVIQASSDLKHIKQLQLIEQLQTGKNDLNFNRGPMNLISGM